METQTGAQGERKHPPDRTLADTWDPKRALFVGSSIPDLFEAEHPLIYDP